MRVGAHESVAGGLHLAFARGEADGCEALQIFTSFNTRWARRRLGAEEASLFRSEHARCGWPVMAHAIYLVNLASPHAALRRKSVAALLHDMELGETLGLDFLVLHPGSYREGEREAGIRAVCAGLSELHRATPGFRLRLLLENTAGQGHQLGRSFAELGRLLEGTAEGHRLGICLDTCHAWVAGYDLASDEGVKQIFDEIARACGPTAVAAFHLNDARMPRGSRRDRHASVGEGTLPLGAFAHLINAPCFSATPAVVETPPDADGRSSFSRNIATLKSLRT